MLVLSAIIEGVHSRKDRSIKIILGTLELSPEKAGELYRYSQDAVFIALKRDNFTTAENEILDNLKADDDLKMNTKTQSQRIRACLYKNWEQKPEGFKEFRSYYDFKTEKYITFLKNKLD